MCLNFGSYAWNNELGDATDLYTAIVVPATWVSRYLPECVGVKLIDWYGDQIKNIVVYIRDQQVKNEELAASSWDKKLKFSKANRWGNDLIFCPVPSGPIKFIRAGQNARRIFEFGKHRGPIAMNDIIVAAKSLILNKPQHSPAVISDRDLLYFLTHGASGYAMRALKSPRNGLTHVLDLSILDQHPYTSSRYIETRFVFFSLTEPLKMQCVMRDGSIVSSDQGFSWNLAKLHTCSSLQYWSLYLSHTWAHFILPDVASTAFDNIIDKSSEFGKWLEPHVRYNAVINNNGLSSFSTFGSDRSLYDDHMSVSESLIPSKLAESSLMERSVAFYFKQFSDISSDMSTKDCGDWIGGFNVEFGFPLVWDTVSPYADKLQKLYRVFHEFASCVVQHLSKEEASQMELWRYHVLKHFPKISPKSSLAHVVATFIFLVSVIHSLEHEHLFQFHALHHCPSTSRKPFATSFSHESVSKMFEGVDIIKANNALEILRFKPSTEDDSFAALNYNFKSIELQQKQKEFIHQVETMWTQLFPRIPFQSIATSLAM